ncbi:phosphate/phosphite/phosphonate ABC transporter substrate-binding protein [Ornithinibacillus gellani]|uniref:phosphate/phosphite/phosphonate ABC transporter substrate-binding protein n=1 Tax=Ornithinibacillus gellani TaxID=2293253 RepID=UPI000F46CB02|nr:phosphate/phosphite/phosphonate ABC transporter substrate-binding protein [Ornithinibacillus gellani]TQS76430.1 phosphate/phosphite/phosphonate ABC transporter substrate-binding protein [Ornithinibacillus gellani]
MKKILGLLLVLILAVGLAACGSDDSKKDDDKNKDEGKDPKTLVMGFVPSQDSENIASTVEPLAERLSEELGITVEGKVMVNYNALVEAMGANQVHIGFIPAFGYVLANEQYDVNVILKSMRHGAGSYRAQYVVRADSGIESLEDLKGKIWTFADKGSTSGYLFPAKQLMEQFELGSAADLETDFFSNVIQAGSHDTAAISVLEGDADVATTFEDVRDNLEEEYPTIKDDLAVIDYTADIPNDTISVTKELSDDLVKKIKEAFLSFNDDEDMIKIMNDVYTWDAIEDAEDSEYQIVKDTYHEFRDIIEQ